MVKDNETNPGNKIDYYDVLGIEDRNISASEIKKRYNKLVAKYHPDKLKDADPQLFSLIQQAWNCLGNAEKRKAYDNRRIIDKNTARDSHLSLKKKFEKFQELKKTEELSETERKKNELSFNAYVEEMNRKMSSGKIKYDDNPMSYKETSSRFNNLMLEREQQEIEFSQNRLFSEGTKFNDSTLQTFNKIFDDYKQKTGKQNIIPKGTGVTAWNIAVANDNNFTSIDTLNGDDSDGIFGTNYSSLDCYGCENNLDVNSIDVKNYGVASYVKDHCVIDDEYEKSLDARLRERKLETEELNSIQKFDENNTDKSFMFTHEIDELWNNSDDSDDYEEDMDYACSKLID